MDTPNGYTDAPQKEGVMSAAENTEPKVMLLMHPSDGHTERDTCLDCAYGAA